MNQTRIFKLFLLAAVFFCSGNNSFAQARLMFGTTATYMRMNGGTSGTPIYLVIGNSASNAITVSAGGIISEGEYNYVKWNIGNATGTGYTIPFRDETLPATENTAISFDVAGAGSAGGFFLASTYDGVTDNATYMPAPVTTMGTITGLLNGSQFVIDRFWALIDEASYPVKPALNNLVFNYPDNEHNLNTGPITESNLQAQRWNSSSANTNKWDGWITGTVNTVANTVSIAALAAADLFRWWTLTDNSNPLPVEFLSFDAACNNGNVLLKWSTATELNSSYFSVERSADGNIFSSIGTVPAAGNSSTVKNYSFTDTDPLNTGAFYRITEADFNGNMQSTNPAAVASCNGDNIFVYSTDGAVYVNITVVADGKYNLELHNVLGQTIARELRRVTKGRNTIKMMPEPATGMYFVTVKNNSNSITKKVFIR